MAIYEFRMTEENYSDFMTALKNTENVAGYYGKLSIGKFDIEILIDDEGYEKEERQKKHIVLFNFYHLGVDSNYGKTKSGVPYSLEEEYAERFDGSEWSDFSGFKNKVHQIAEAYFKRKYTDPKKYAEEVACPVADWA